MKHRLLKTIILLLTLLMLFSLMNRFHFITDYVLYTFYIITIFYGFFLVVIKPRLYTYKAFLPYVVILCANFVALIANPSFSALQYMIVKFGLLSISMGGIYYYRDYFIDQFPKILKNGLLLTLALSVILEPSLLGVAEGYAGIFGTRNELGLVAAMAFGLILIEKSFSKRNILLLIFTIILVLLSTSRAAVVGVLVGFLIAGFSWRKILALGIVALASLYIVSDLHIISGLDRLSAESATAGRDQEFFYGLATFQQYPWFGWGLDKYAFIDESVVPLFLLEQHFVLNPHNSYLAMYIQYGAVLATLIFIMLLYFSGKVLFNTKIDKNIRFMLSFILVNAIVESYLFSISGLPGFLFWFYLGLGLTVLSDLKKEQHKAYNHNAK
ncbi:hypothetical protein B649_08435 [Candidatus Sulfuricurvum sp. RIFRC-1]|uniref:O-antigen ligase family protein n=1 Tax=Candidatus Sulfuricurvum sp. RIFRC-1 TaxID=1249480 RepID=UPI000299626E|nr:O-antigen ligase family protein [Candidatus Sulfuricurvum sp. RIFRC-1]AFV97999.1 hypothetical protein B649_08435 [Candidatus Sulfuricurvum sp. RIFRC-1]